MQTADNFTGITTLQLYKTDYTSLKSILVKMLLLLRAEELIISCKLWRRLQIE